MLCHCERLLVEYCRRQRIETMEAYSSTSNFFLRCYLGLLINELHIK